MRRIVVSHRADARLAVAEAWLDAASAGSRRLVLASSITAASEVTRRASWRHGASFGWHRTTLPLLALELARPLLAARRLAPASPMALDAVSARAIARLRRENALGRFASAAETAGFARAVSRTLRDIRLAGVAASRLPSDLAIVAETWEDERVAAHLADEAAVLALAAKCAKERRAELLGIPTLWSDLRLRSPAEAELLGAIARRAPDVLALAPARDRRTIEYLEHELDVPAEALAPDVTDSLSRLQAELFEECSTVTVAPSDAVIAFSAPGEDRECVEIARRILALAGEGTPFDRIAVLVRAPNAYRVHLEEAFGRAQIPAWWVQGTRMPDPAGRALLALLACRAQDYSARRFAEYLSLGELPSAARPTDDTRDATEAQGELAESEVRVPRRWEQLLNDAAVIGGLDRWRRRLDGLEASLRAGIDALAGDPPRQEREERRLDQLAALRAFAWPILERLAALPTSATWDLWLSELAALAEMSLRDPDRVLQVLGGLCSLGPVGPVGLDEVRLVLAPHLQELAAPSPSRRGGRVFVGFVDAARGLDFDVVFVPGMAERGFPQRILEDPLLLDRVRVGLPPLETHTERVEDERLQLRIAVGAARSRVYLSWPRLEIDAVRPRVPSFYALEALRAAEGALPPLASLTARADRAGGARIGWPAPEEPTQAVDDAEYDLAFLGGLLHHRDDAPRGSARWLLLQNTHLARALRARWSRWSTKLHQWDGLHAPDDEVVRAALREWLPSRRAWAATALELYARCPYRLYLRGIQRLAPREEAAAVDELDPVSRGSIVTGQRHPEDRARRPGDLDAGGVNAPVGSRRG